MPFGMPLTQFDAEKEEEDPAIASALGLSTALQQI
jgi:hypothetical protein